MCLQAQGRKGGLLLGSKAGYLCWITAKGESDFKDVCFV